MTFHVVFLNLQLSSEFDKKFEKFRSEVVEICLLFFVRTIEPPDSLIDGARGLVGKRVGNRNARTFFFI